MPSLSPIKHTVKTVQANVNCQRRLHLDAVMLRNYQPGSYVEPRFD